MESNRPPLPPPHHAASAKTWSRRIYHAGLALFLASRLLGIWGGCYVNETTRNGGDALTYLWHAHASLHGFPSDSPAIRSVKQQLAGHDLKFGEKADGIYPLFFHTMLQGTATPLYDVILGSLYALVGDDGLAYALMETLTALIMTAGAGCFLRHLVGWRAAGLALLLMAVMTLPRQGINTMIASLAATALALWIAGALLRPGREKSAWMFVGVVCLVLVHAIGVVFVALLGCLTVLISWRRQGHLLRGRVPWFIAMAAVAFGLRLLLYALVPGMGQPQEYHGVVHEWGLLAANTQRAIHYIYDVLRKNLAVLLLATAGVLHLRARFFTPRMRWFFLCWGLVAIATLAHYLPGFKADVFGRVLVIPAFALCGLAARGYFCPSVPQWVKTAACALFLVQATNWVVTQLGEQMHFNWYAFDLNRAGAVLREHPPEERLLFVEGGETLQTLMLAGAGSREILWMPAFTKEPHPWQITMEHTNWTGVIAPPRELNSLAMIRPPGFAKMREGVSFHACTGFQIEAQDHRELPALTLVFRSANTLDRMLLVPYDKAGGRLPAQALQTTRSASGKEWTVQGTGLCRLDVMLPEEDNWLLGLHTSAMGGHLRWPWNSGLILRYSARGVRGNPMYAVDFDLRHAIQTQATGNLPPPPFEVEPEDDSSGLIFFRRREP